MDRLAKLVAAAFAAVAGVAYVPVSHAGYAQLAPPSGWSPGGGLAGPGGAVNIPTAASNGGSYSGGTVRVNPALNVGGRAVTVPAAQRLAVNAGRVAAAAAFALPTVRVALGVAAWLGVAGLVWDAASGLWKQPDSSARMSDGYEYGDSTFQPTLPQACDAYLQNLISIGAIVSGSVTSCVYPGASTFVGKMPNGATNDYTVYLKRRPSACPSGWYSTPGGCVQTPPMRTVTEQEFVDGITKNPMPDSVPSEIPSPLPVEVPQIVPMFIPTGNPVPNPAYDPNAAPSPANQPYTQPGVNVEPAPSPSSPWQVDVQPVNRPVASPNPNPDPVPNTNPDGTPKPNPGDKPREATDAEKQDLCEKHPDIVACQKLDEVKDVDLESKEKPISITPDSGWGAEDAACPAPRILHVQGREIPIPFDLFCTYMRGIRPIIIAMAWLSAAFILVGAREASA